MQFSFTINGTHEGRQKNAIPKIKKTARQYWTKEVKRYTLWRKHVQAEFLQQLKEVNGKEAVKLAENVLIKLRPIPDTKKRIEVKMIIYFKGERHADPENVFGSIADALLQQDKHVKGEFDYRHVERDPHVDVIINW